MGAGCVFYGLQWNPCFKYKQPGRYVIRSSNTTIQREVQTVVVLVEADLHNTHTDEAAGHMSG